MITIIIVNKNNEIRKKEFKMKIGVIAANGRVGRHVVEDAVKAGDDVTAIVRHENQTNAQKVLMKDLFDLTLDDIKDLDVIVDAFGVWEPSELVKHQTSLAHLTKILAGTSIRLVVVGGAGSLYVDSEKKTHLMDTPDFPDEFKPLANAMGKAFQTLKKVNNVRWTYISPAADFQANGPQKGKYQIAGDELTTDENGVSAISYADYAQALVDEIHNDKYEQQRISVRW